MAFLFGLGYAKDDPMKKYVVKRILFVIPIMLILSFLTFVLTYLSPADPAALYFESRNIHPEEGQIEAMREEMGLNDPLLVRYGRWLVNVLHGDLGTSYFYSTPVMEEMMKRIPNTLMLAGATVLMTILLAVPLGIITAVYQNKWIDYLLRFISFFGVSMPSFWVGTLLMYFFGVKLHMLPIMGSGDIQHLILPAMTLTFWMTSVYIRRVRGWRR
jgi:peptide/nickel transport system permease protein